MTTTAKIAAKGTNGTGLTEDVAKKCHDQLGRKVLAVVELVAETRSEKRNGDESVSLSILTVEPAPNGATEEHLRELARSFYYERQLVENGPTLDAGGDGIEPDLKTVLAAGQKHEPHPPILSMLSTDDDPVCDVCGQVRDAPLHQARARLADPFTADDQDDDAAAGDDPRDQDDYAHDDSTPGYAVGGTIPIV